MMTRNAMIFVLMMLAAAAGAQNSHVILISVDGLRPEFYKDPSWEMVNLRQGLQKGAHSDGVNGVFPSVTYPSHTAMITGQKPLKHGIYYNTPVETDSITGKWYWDYKGIKVPTVFDLAKQKGLVTASVFWPVTLNSAADYVVPEYWYLPKKKGEERNMLKALEENATPKGLFAEIQQQATGKLEPIDFNGDYYGIDDINAQMACYLIRKHKPALLSLHLVTVDHFEHEQGRDGDKVRTSLTVVDGALRKIVEATKKAGIYEQTTFIITGDHGFVNIHNALAPNVLLRKAGLYAPNSGDNWKAYFHASGGATFLHLKNPADKATLEKVKSLLAQLPAEQQQFFKIKTRQQLDAIGADPNAALALAAEKGYTFSSDSKGEFIRSAKGGTHGYFPDFKEIQTGFVAFGKGIRKGAVVPEMNLTDIAPLIAHLLGLQMDAGIDGKLHPQLLNSAVSITAK
ncbi:alkaline phosphatase family protein [Paracnuella aquatica]|uniref:alkaline phosphatase family protein n=1 Tax=Paracnuella aquatica TaxID=2268757 RepID=UPI0019D4CF38|nr:alkaline phosphatase family protein [Paracnuella aquatica]